MSNEFVAPSLQLPIADLPDENQPAKPQAAFKKPRSTVAGVIFSMLMPYPTVPGMVLTTAVQGIVPPSVKTSIKKNTKADAVLPLTIAVELRNPLMPEKDEMQKGRGGKVPERTPTTPTNSYALPGNGRRMRAWQTATDEQPVPYIPKPDRRAIKFTDQLKLQADTKDISGKGV